MDSLVLEVFDYEQVLEMLISGCIWGLILGLSIFLVGLGIMSVISVFNRLTN